MEFELFYKTEHENRKRSSEVVLQLSKTVFLLVGNTCTALQTVDVQQAVCAIRPQSSMGAQFTNFARNVNSPSVMGKFSIYFILISSHFDYVLYYYIEKECLVLMCA